VILGNLKRVLLDRVSHEHYPARCYFVAICNARTPDLLTYLGIVCTLNVGLSEHAQSITYSSANENCEENRRKK